MVYTATQNHHGDVYCDPLLNVFGVMATQAVHIPLG